MAETVMVIRPPARDNFGDRPTGLPLEWQVPGWEFAPGPSTEQNAGATQVDSDGTLYGPPVVDVNAIVAGGIKPTDVIQVRGDDYEVVGRVQDWGDAGCVIVLKRVTG